MTYVSNDPTWWPNIYAVRVQSYFVAAVYVVVTYDWALTFGQEVELIWRQRWSLMTVMYLGVRYLGILYAALSTLTSISTISLTDMQCWIIYIACYWTGVMVFAMLWVIIIARLHAMYQGSRKILIFLIVNFLAVNISGGGVGIMAMMDASGEELILSGTYQCQYNYTEDLLFMISISWIIATVWEAIALCLAVWIAVKHFHELRHNSAGGIIEDCFTVLMETHVVYFASFVAVSCFHLILDFYPTFSAGYSPASYILSGFMLFFTVVQMFVLGPRLILGVREYYAKLVANSDAATGMAPIAFQERVHISTGSGV